MAIGLRILDVDFLMCHVHVAANQHGLLLVKTLEIKAECVVPCHALVETLKPILRVGGIDGNDEEGVVFKGDDTTFGVHIHPTVIRNGRDNVFR